MTEVDYENADEVEVMPGVYFTSKNALKKAAVADAATNSRGNESRLDMSSPHNLVSSLDGVPYGVMTLKDNLNFYNLSVKHLIRSQEELRNCLAQEEFKNDPDIELAISENCVTLEKFKGMIKTIEGALDLLGVANETDVKPQV